MTLTPWYNHAHYFDLLFRDETAAEVRFFRKAFKRFAKIGVHRLIEPGCGSGRLVRAMASRGYDVTGVDLNPHMLAYLDRELSADRKARPGATDALVGATTRVSAARTVLGDMTRLRLSGRFDAAFCTFNTFRHLMTEADVVSHLRSLADHLEPGGIYILGFHIIPLDADEQCTEKWKASDADVRVRASLKVIDFNRMQRRETLRIKIKATHRDGTVQRIRDQFPLRLYTHDQVAAMIESVDDVFELAGTFDFDYAIRRPRILDDDLTDAVLVLRRR